MSSTIMIPVSKLQEDPKNVRKTYDPAGIAELADSIEANGVVQNLIVRPAKRKGSHYVTAGRRRFRALMLLLEQQRITNDYEVECKPTTAANAIELSLTENVMREAMHPADEFEAYTALYEQGRQPDEIAQRFGKPEIHVLRRLALARVAPELRERFRQGEMTLQHLEAMTLSNDHARQVELWNSLPSYARRPSDIRRHLTQEEVPATDKRVVFVGGLKAYFEAGGLVRRDMFDGENEGYVTDSGHLEKVVLDKLNVEADPIRAEGWKWVEVYNEQPDNIFSFQRVYPEPVELSDEDAARLDKLSAEYDELAELIEAGVADEAEPRAAEIDAEMAALQTRRETYRPEDLARAGAIVCLDYYGSLKVHRGLVRTEDMVVSTDEDDEAASDDNADVVAAKPATLTHSAALIEDLTAQKTAALRVELANNHDIALAAVVHALLLRAIHGDASYTALQIELTHESMEESMKQPEASMPARAFAELSERWGDHIPGDPRDLWEWCLDQPRDRLLELLAFAAAHSLNAKEGRFHGRGKALAHAREIGRALNVDMRNWFTTTAESYFDHINRRSIEIAVAQARGADFATGIASMKKSEATSKAERLVKNTGWLPEPIRIAPDDAVEAAGNEADEFEAETYPVAAE